MKILPGAIITDLRGTAGGHTAQGTRSGLVLHAKALPSQPPISLNTQFKRYQANSSLAWRSLTQAQRNTWEAAVPRWAGQFSGSNKQSTNGFLLYRLLYLRSRLCSLDPLTLPPVITVPFESVITTATADLTPLRFNITTAVGTPSGTQMIFSASRQFLGVTVPARAQVVFMRSVPGNGAVTQTILSEYAARFGDFKIGAGIRVSLYWIDRTSLTRSQTVYKDTIVTP